MFLGPLEQHKPWDTKGITGVYNFLKRLWNFIVDENGNIRVRDEEPTKEELKALHQTIKKVREDIERLAFNTCVSQFMIYLNFLTKRNACKRALIEPFLILLSPFAPHVAEELWERLGHKETIQFEPYPQYDPQYLVEDTFEYPVAVNGKVRAKIVLPLNLNEEEIQKRVLEVERIQKYIAGKKIKRIIHVPKRMINLVVG